MKTRIVVEGEDAVYHVVSRTAFRLRNFRNAEKKVFRNLLRNQAEFAGVEVLTFCVLEEHFHVLVRVPHADSMPSDDEFLRRYRCLYGNSVDTHGPHTLSPEKLESIFEAGGEKAELWRKRLFARMNSVSIFVKELKHRFCIWYNRKHENVGTIWSKRFSSILIENVPEVLKQVSAYIDLNPVRLKICENPKDYPFTGYGSASLGDSTSRKGIASCLGSVEDWQTLLKRYRRILKDWETGLVGSVSNFGGVEKGVIGSRSFVQQWSAKHEQTLKQKGNLGYYLACGALWVGCALVGGSQAFKQGAYR